MANSPLRPDEYETYRTAVDTEDEPEPAGVSPASNPGPWVVIGMFLLGVFVLALIVAVVAAVG